MIHAYQGSYAQFQASNHWEEIGGKSHLREFSISGDSTHGFAVDDMGDAWRCESQSRPLVWTHVVTGFPLHQASLSWYDITLWAVAADGTIHSGRPDASEPWWVHSG